MTWTSCVGRTRSFIRSLQFPEDARANVKNKIAMVETIQKFPVKAQEQAELKLKVCKDMAHAKHKELTEALAELLKAKELLAKLGVFGYADHKVKQLLIKKCF
ncbi:hypothetical protein Fot_42037 [Forsythia ovata]|uniref:Uncharacterized protein n=1 Tax=Forsythia ovata TaxID=205694 RepID=A0ABD1RK18_9LAMI